MRLDVKPLNDERKIFDDEKIFTLIRTRSKRGFSLPLAHQSVENKRGDVNVWNLQLPLSIPMAAARGITRLLSRHRDCGDNLPDNVPYQIRLGAPARLSSPSDPSFSFSLFLLSPSFLVASYLHFSQNRSYSHPALQPLMKLYNCYSLKHSYSGQFIIIAILRSL